ncbi:RecQ-mediated genome instability protein 1 [Zootermopsis nevadensis]|uniref:RecQ-mediated genome instability protein 1 n=1 Tax=Zootermopsis nevadensis TaxID=136037 RepID=A0A067QK69_ZOONE|nr:RecQ-mediated genome instability protein 1 [Zootermopsis nevadensis]
MVAYIVAGIKKYLTSTSLHASPEWVEGCVEFFISEHQSQGYTVSALEDFVLQQWKLADLREIGQGCLPHNISSIMKIILPGKYALQVEQVQNVGQPAYAQLQDIRKQTCENETVGATLSQSWEPCPTRMLQLTLCDGIQSIKGIEYRPIMSLNEQILPGYKVLVIGPVECRRGVLLLEQHNLEILGGEVDSLLVPNAIENVLARLLNLPQNPDPYRVETDVSVGPQEPTTTRNVFVQPPPIQPNPTGSLRTQVVSAPVQNIIHKPSSSRININQVSKGNPDRSIEEELLCEDDLMLEAEMDAQLSVLEREYQEEMENSLHNTDIETEQGFLGDVQAESSENIEFESLHHQKVPTQLETPSYSPEKELMANSNTIHLLEDDDDDDILLQMSLDALDEPKVERKLQRDQSTSSRLVRKQDHWSGHQTKALSAGQCSRVSTQIVKSQAHSITTQSKITSFLKSSIKTADSGGSSHRCGNSSETDRAAQLSCSKQIFPNLGLNITHDCNENLQTKSDKKPIQPKVYGNDVTSTVPILTDSKPFVYLSQVKTPVKSRTVFTVKGFVMTLLSQMTFGKDGWHLLVKVCDGSSNLDVRLSSDVLEKLMSFSRAEMLAMKQEIPDNPVLKEKLRNILQNAQQQLIHLNCLLDIEFLPESEIPCVIELTTITEEHLQALQARVRTVDTDLIKKFE